jgi:hypothetical protein
MSVPTPVRQPFVLGLRHGLLDIWGQPCHRYNFVPSAAPPEPLAGQQQDRPKWRQDLLGCVPSGGGVHAAISACDALELARLAGVYSLEGARNEGKQILDLVARRDENHNVYACPHKILLELKIPISG